MYFVPVVATLAVHSMGDLSSSGLFCRRGSSCYLLDTMLQTRKSLGLLVLNVYFCNGAVRHGS